MDASSAADSVFSFIEATAEACGADGREYCWRTFDYDNRPQYHYSIFNGVGGIPIFLAAYHEATGNARALELARGAIAWCLQAKVEAEGGDHRRGLQFGRAGLAWSVLCLERASGREEFPGTAEELADHILSEPPGPITDLIGGEASNGWLLLQIWERTGEGRWLEGAARCARWLEDQMVRDELGTWCAIDPVNWTFGPKPHAGLAHGIAGVAHFFTALYGASGEARWREIAVELLGTLVAHARPARGGLNWAPGLGGGELTRCQHSHGAPGIGLVMARAARVLGEGRYLDIARQAGEATWQYGDYRNNPTLCTGLAGGGELLAELFRETGEELWLERAREFARMAAEHRVTIDGRDFWPTDALATPGGPGVAAAEGLPGSGCYSADFFYGAAGTGYFFLRAAHPHKFAAALL